MIKRLAILLFLASLLPSCNSISEKEKQYSQVQNTASISPQDGLQESIERGRAIYTDFCITCHNTDGKGQANTFPPLAGSDYLINYRNESIRSVKYGQQGEITVNGVTYNSVMAPLGLENDEVADVMNYIMNSWGNTQNKMVTIVEVSAVEK
jgi:mono/diheme cytochrome c family protein